MKLTKTGMVQSMLWYTVKGSPEIQQQVISYDRQSDRGKFPIKPGVYPFADGHVVGLHEEVPTHEYAYLGDLVILKDPTDAVSGGNFDRMLLTKVMLWLSSEFFVDEEQNICHTSYYELYNPKVHPYQEVKYTKPWADLIESKVAHISEIPSGKVSWGYEDKTGRRIYNQPYGHGMMAMTTFDFSGRTNPEWRRGCYKWFGNDYDGKKFGKIGFLVKLVEGYHDKKDRDANWADPISSIVTVEKFVGDSFFVTEFGYICQIRNYGVIKGESKLYRRALILD